MHGLTYREIGATRSGVLPAGFHHLRYRTCLGPVALEVAGEAILTWQMHRAADARIGVSTPRAAAGGTVISSLGVGPLRISAACRVVEVVAGPNCAGLVYGTLAGHPARGEEAFVVERTGDGRVWFTVTAFSIPARWYMRVAGPLALLLQRAFAWRCGRALRRLCAVHPRSRGGGDPDSRA